MKREVHVFAGKLGVCLQRPMQQGGKYPRKYPAWKQTSKQAREWDSSNYRFSISDWIKTLPWESGKTGNMRAGKWVCCD